MLNSYIETYGAVLKDETLEHLTDAVSWVSIGKFCYIKCDDYEGGRSNVTKEGVEYAELVMNALKEVDKELRQTVRSPSGS